MVISMHLERKRPESALLPGRHSMPRSLLIGCVLYAAGLCAFPSNAQEAPSTDRPQETPKSEEVRPSPPSDSIAQPSSPGIVVQPTDAEGLSTPREGVTGVLNQDVRPSQGRLLIEGTLLIGRRGRVFGLDNDQWVFVFDADQQGRREKPMILQPCLQTMEMKRIVEARPEQITFRINGSVSVYRGRNYLRPLLFTTVAPDSTTPPQSDPRPEDYGDAQNDPSVRDLLRRIESSSTAEQRADSPVDPASPAIAESSAPRELLREGMMIVSRRGRLVRGWNGGWDFAFDNGPDARDRADAPLAVMPCMILQAMESLIQAHGDDVVFTISGEVTVYENRNYLLPTVFVVEIDREGNLNPAP